jgi:alpha-tubulin suppressor-like RCC1 family protein
MRSNFGVIYRCVGVLVIVSLLLAGRAPSATAATPAARRLLKDLLPGNGLADASAVAAGWWHTCALTAGGGVKCWGVNVSGQLGDGTTDGRTMPVGAFGLSSGVTAIAAGVHHTCALTGGGAVKCWGNNGAGQLGIGTTDDHTTPVDVTALGNGVTAIAAGWDHTCALTIAGAVKCWGGNIEGQLGDGTTDERAVPVDVTGLNSGVNAVTAGGNHTCALTSGGGVKCWGSNAAGQLGNGTTDGHPMPVDVSGLDSGVTGIAAGRSHTCALTSASGVTCWGSNSSGQLGDGTTDDRTVPVDVNGLDSGVVAITAGGFHTCALMSGGAVKCWGSNAEDQIGNATIVLYYAAPVAVAGLDSGVTAFGAGGYHTCAVTSTGAVKCWGSNLDGQLGNGRETSRSPAPLAVRGLSSGVTAIAAGGSHTCALTSTGGLKCWGSNTDGQLGNGWQIGRDAPVRLPVDVSGLTSGVTAVTARGRHTCALTSSGGVKCWGANYTGELGDGTKELRTTPVDVSGLSSGVLAITAGGSHNCALTNAGGIKCWGSNSSGQLGDGTTEDRTVPVDVTGLASSVTAIAAGGSHTCALTSAGSIKCWGANSTGQLGTGTTDPHATPVDVSGLANGVAAISAGAFHTCAVTSAGAVKCWGYNYAGQLGDGTKETRFSPVNVVGLDSGAAEITANETHSCARTAAGGVKCWGSNYAGQLGDGTVDDRLAPADVTGLSDEVMALAVGGMGILRYRWAHTCALTTRGSVWCWGSNGYGQLGVSGSSTPASVVGLGGWAVLLPLLHR